MKYDTIWFDADETLFDFSATELQAFTQTFREFGWQGEMGAIYSTYRAESDILWALLEKGAIQKEFLRDERFERTLSAHRVPGSAKDFSARYLEILPETCTLVDYAMALCEKLSARQMILGIITNGFESIQQRRLEVSGLAPFISFMVASEACGYAKPDLRFFEHAASQSPKFSKERVLVVGDRLETDILGAAAFGVDSCWFNPHGLPNLTQVKPTYEINHLSELERLLLF